MTSLLISHKQVSRFSNLLNQTEEVRLAGRKKAGRLLVRPLITGAKRCRCASGKLWSVVAICLAVLPASLRAEFVYVVDLLSNDILAYRIALNGALTPVVGSPFPAGDSPRSVAMDILGQFVYVANSGSNTDFSGSVSAYSIGQNGVLTPVAGSPFPGGRESFSVSVDLLGRFVYVANADSDNVSAYRIGRNGGPG